MLALCLASANSGAGLDYGPVSTRDGQGRAAILLPISVTGEAVPLPLVLRYAPAGGEAGLFSGGWSLPLFETRIYQVDERTFQMNDFMGFAIRFLRERGDPAGLRGSGGWRARMDGRRIEAESPAGWKISFVQGRPEKIVSPDGSEFSYTDNGRSLVARDTRNVVADVDFRDGRVAAVRVGDSSVSFDYAKLPVFASLGGKPVVSALVEMPNGVRVDGVLQYQVHLEPDENGAVRLSVEQGGSPPRSYSWDADTKKIRTANLEHVSEDPKTGRTFFDGPFGRRVIVRPPGGAPSEIDASGMQTTYYAFPGSSGVPGLRKVVTDRNGAVYTRSVDACGRTLRERDLRSGGEELRVYAYDGEEVRVERFHNHVLIEREIRTPKRTERSLLAEGATVTMDADTIEILWKK